MNDSELKCGRNSFSVLYRKAKKIQSRAQKRVRERRRLAEYGSNELYEMYIYNVKKVNDTALDSYTHLPDYMSLRERKIRNSSTILRIFLLQTLNTRV